jgi:hypothetical protein
MQVILSAIADLQIHPAILTQGRQAHKYVDPA